MLLRSHTPGSMNRFVISLLLALILAVAAAPVAFAQPKDEPAKGPPGRPAVERFRELPPEQRDALRQRWAEERQRRAEREGPGRRLSPEERRQLRDQINETNRGLRWQQPQRPEPRRRGRR